MAGLSSLPVLSASCAPAPAKAMVACQSRRRNRAGVAQFVEHILADAHMSRLELAAIWSAVLFNCSLLLPFAGRMCDKHGCRAVLVAVIVPYSLLLIVMGKVTSTASFAATFFFMRLIGPGVLVLIGSTAVNHVRDIAFASQPAPCDCFARPPVQRL